MPLPQLTISASVIVVGKEEHELQYEEPDSIRNEEEHEPDSIQYEEEYEPDSTRNEEKHEPDSIQYEEKHEPDSPHPIWYEEHEPDSTPIQYEEVDEHDWTRYDEDELNLIRDNSDEHGRIMKQLLKDTGTLFRYSLRLMQRDALPLKQSEENRRLLSKKIKARREEHGILMKMCREGLFGELESIKTMLSEMAIECDSKLKKLHLEYVDAIWMMQLKVNQAYNDYTKLLRRSMDLQTKISLFVCKLNKCPGMMTEVPKYDSVNVLKEYMAAFQMMRVKSELDLKVHVLLSQKSMDLSWKPFVDSKIKDDAVNSLFRNVDEKDEGHSLVYKYKLEAEDGSVVGGREDEVGDGHISYQWSLHGDDPEWNPRLLERDYFDALIERLPARLGHVWLAAVSTRFKELEFSASMLKKKETSPARHDKSQQQQDYERWEGECRRVAKALSRNNASYSRRIDSLNAIVSDVASNYMNTLQIMTGEFGSVIELMKSTHRLIQQDNVCLERLVACQETELFSIQYKSSGETVQDSMHDVSPLCNGGTWSSSEILSSILTQYSEPGLAMSW